MKRADAPFVLALLLGLSGCEAPLQPPTPPILQGLTNGREQFEMCPRADPGRRWQIALSPEFESRLQQLAPAGAPEESVLQALSSQGFHQDRGPCSDDPAVHAAAFFQREGGGLFAYPVLAKVYWRVNSNNRIEWIHGDVAYLGP
jgi:hypothetical protein